MMRIIHLAAGAGSMYCGACARDAAMARALIARGHDVQIVPLYTPLRIEGAAPPVSQVRLGALNAYLQQLSGLFSRMPRALTRLLDHEGLLRGVARFGVNVDPAGLGPMTVSVLAGIDGRQRIEIERIVRFIEDEARPDLVSITNSLLSGVAPAIKRKLGLPILCEVKGEDGFIDAIPEPHRSEAVELMRRNARSVDLFLAPSRSYAAAMAEFLQVDPGRIEVVRSILDADTFARRGPRPREPFTLGYLSVITPRKGLHVLVDALGHLTREGRDARLVVAGQVLDRRYWREIRRSLRVHDLASRFDYRGEVDFTCKLNLLQSLSVFCQPSIKPEALGTSALEAMAAGVPVVAADLGVMPEVIDLTGGGVLFAAGEGGALATVVSGLIDDPEAADRIGESGARGINEHYTAATVAAGMERILQKLVAQGPADGGENRGEEAL